MRLVFIPSPLLGPAVWRPVAEVLTAEGFACHIVRHGGAAPRTPVDVLAEMDAGLPGDEIVLIPHSNAGLYVPALTRSARVAAAVFVDAILPPSRGPVPTAPPENLPMLTDLADADGLLPEWTAWWPPGAVDGLFADDVSRRAVEAEQRRLPLDYFRAVVDVPDGWDRGLAGAYLAFGETYAADRAAAADRGWPTRTMDGGHLHQVVDPSGVAAALVDLLP